VPRGILGAIFDAHPSVEHRSSAESLIKSAAAEREGQPQPRWHVAILYRITWTTWSATKAVGTGTYELDACTPSCAAGPVDPVPTVVTFSQPVKVCSSSGTHWVWSRASFTFPHGLPRAFQGQNAPANPWTFTPLIAAAQQSCP
jgi:hypothetical protein